MCTFVSKIKSNFLIMELLIGNCYTKAEIEATGLTFVKSTSITMFYRKGEMLYVFEAKCKESDSKYKLTTIIKD